jgi:hypothetical protein
MGSVAVVEVAPRNPVIRTPRSAPEPPRAADQIICCKCHKATIAAPEGATEKTRFICRACAPLGVADEAFFDRFQFDDAEFFPRVGKEKTTRKTRTLTEILGAVSGSARQELSIRELASAFSEIAEDAEIDEGTEDANRGRISVLARMACTPKPASIRIVEAREAGEPWALAATRENLRLLPDQQRVALVAFYWGGLNAADVGRLLGTTAGTVKSWLSRARRFLDERYRIATV